MNIEIRIGDISKNNRIKYPSVKLDNTREELIRMYEFLSNSNNVIIEDVDMFLFYAVNNMLFANNVKDKVVDEDEYFSKLKKLDRNDVKIISIDSNGIETEIFATDDIIRNEQKQYFNDLMGIVMDDFYTCLNYLD